MHPVSDNFLKNTVPLVFLATSRMHNSQGFINLLDDGFIQLIHYNFEYHNLIFDGAPGHTSTQTRRKLIQNVNPIT